MVESPRNKNKTVLIVLSLILAGCAFVPLDAAISSRLMDGLLPGDVREILRRAEPFGHGFGLIAIAVTIYFLDRQWASRVPRLLTHGAAAGLLADVIKMSVWRVRPRFAGLVEQSFTGTFLSASAKDWSNVLDSRYHSFPSAHTAVAVAAAVTLGRFYPAARGWFLCLALLCAVQRVDGGSHYPSDVFWGAALGYAVAQACWNSSRLATLLERCRHRLDRHALATAADEPARRAA